VSTRSQSKPERTLSHVVVREEPRQEWMELATRYGATFCVVECICSDTRALRARVDGRSRSIPGWYELTWADVQRSHANYVPLDEPKLVVVAVLPASDNVARALDYVRDAE
jgi:hypothetical protein